MTETYKNNAGTVPIIAPLNEWVYPKLDTSSLKSYFSGQQATEALLFSMPLARSVNSINSLLPLLTSRKFWYDSYGNIRWDSQGKETNIVSLIHDAFQSLSYWKDFQPYPQYEGVALDTHIYVMFSEAVGNQTSLFSASVDLSAGEQDVTI